MIPWAKPVYWGQEEAYVLEALRSTWISGGPFVEKLEAGFKALTGRDSALAVTNGTAALHLAYLALGLGPGDEVIVPGFGFQAAANVAIQMGATPVFAEVDPATWCLTAGTAAPLITPRTRLLVAVHTYGNVCAMDPLLALGVTVLEDTAEALGSTCQGRQAGSMGHLGTYSFHATKTITTGEGGMVVTSDPALAERMFLYRSHGLYRRQHYWHEVPGNNFRLTNLQAALGVAQFEHLEAILAARKDVDASYRRLLEDAPGLAPMAATRGVEPVPWSFPVRLDPAHFPQGRDAVMAALAQAGIETRPGFVAPSLMPHIYTAGPLPVCEDLSRQVLSLPSYPSLTGQELRRVCDALLAARSAP